LENDVRFIVAFVENYTSYDFADFKFNNSNGVVLICGPTGTGKSSFCDMIPWILFGKTKNNGSVDEVKSWFSSEPTCGTTIINTDKGEYAISRIRGTQNDLYYNLNVLSAEKIRGKDLNDTQKLINELLGMNCELYLAAYYYHEFSQTAQFFTSTAKSRRQLIENLVDLSMPKKLAEQSAEYKKDIKEEITSKKQELDKIVSKEQFFIDNITKNSESKYLWQLEHAKKIVRLEKAYKNFENTKQERLAEIESNWEGKHNSLTYEIAQLISSLKDDTFYTKKRENLELNIKEVENEKCETCGAPKNNETRSVLIRDLNKLDAQQKQDEYAKVLIRNIENNHAKAFIEYEKQMKLENSRQNIYDKELELVKLEKNPFMQTIKTAKVVLQETRMNITITKTQLSELHINLADIELLEEVLAKFRQTLCLNMVQELEDSTNQLLNDYFDAELRVAFDLEGNDKLEITIHKDGNEASYTQLSKGQRALLKLCFSVAVMKSAANHNALEKDTLWFDEALDGLDAELKVKAVKLFEHLATIYKRIYIVDHSQELKTMINKHIVVKLENSRSIIEES
jgi:DNA repair exonuclease SbcCD ATPase subunit